MAHDDLGLLSPAEARKKLRQLYQNAELYTAIPRNQVAKKKELWAKDPFQFLADVLPHRFKRNPREPAPFGEFHEEMWKETQDPQNKPVLVCGFRGCGKSSLLNFGRHLYDICFERVNYGIIGSINEYKAKRLILPILLELEENPVIHAVFGNLTDNRIWSTKTFVTKNKIRYEALGITQSSMGSLHNNFRPDVVTLDDIISTESARSTTQSDSLLFWFWSDILPAMRPEVDGGWRGWICATMVSTLSPIYKMFYDEDYNGKIIRLLYNILKEDGSSQWPERYSKERIETIRKETPAFSWHGERQMPPLASTELMFEKDQIQKYQEKDLLGKNLHTLAFMDPASRTGNQNDNSALVVVSIDMETGEMFVRRGSIYGRMTEDKIVKQCFYVKRLYGNITFIFEGNGFQRLFKYIFKLQHQIKKHSIKVETIDRTGNKFLRMTGLIPYLNEGMLKFLDGDPEQKKGCEDMLLVKHVESSAHDDWPDGLIGAVDALQDLITQLGLSSEMNQPSEYQREHKDIQEILKQSQHRGGYLFGKNSMEQVIEQLLVQDSITHKESYLEKQVRQAIERGKYIHCPKHRYLDVRNYLLKWRDIFSRAEQIQKSDFAQEEIIRLDQRFATKTYEYKEAA